MFAVFHGQEKCKCFDFSLDDDEFEEHTQGFVQAATAANTHLCTKLFEDFVVAASVPDLCLPLLYLDFEHIYSTLGCVV